MVYATWQVGQVLWSMAWFAFFFLTIWLVVMVLSDIFRSRDTGGVGKALWTLFVLVLPWLGVFAYLLAHGKGMAERRIDPDYRTTAPVGYHDLASSYATRAGPPPGTDLSTLADLRTRGIIDDAELVAMQQRLATP